MNRKCLLLVSAVLVVFSTIPAKGMHINLKVCTNVFVGITVSSLVDTSPPRQMELVWANANPQGSDYVALYDDSAMTSALVKIPISSANGYGATGVAAPVTDVDNLTFEKKCLGYYVAYVRNNDQVLASGCLETNPRWMEEMKSAVSVLTLRTTFLPGVHDAAAYKTYDGSSENIVTKYTYTQEEEVLSLLVYGARYLDMRVEYRANNADPWWTNHGPSSLRPLQITLDQVKRFMDQTDEIVIFDIHGLTGFGNSSTSAGIELNNAFAAHLETELGAWAVPSSLTWGATLGAVWASGRRLIVTYPDSRVVAAHPSLWPAVSHRWANTNNVQGLYDYGESVFSRPPPFNGWAFMAELTATPVDVTLDRLGGLRKMADLVNQDVSTWFSHAWGKTANIVASDFFRGNTIVSEAIEWNLYRATGNTCRYKVTKKHQDKTKKNKAPSHHDKTKKAHGRKKEIKKQSG